MHPGTSSPERDREGAAFIETAATLSRSERAACWFSTRSGASLPGRPPPPGPARTDRRTLTLGVAEAAAVADAGAAPPLHALQVLAVEEAAPSGGAGELGQHRVELTQRLRQVPAVLPRPCRAATAASGPDRTRPPPAPPPRRRERREGNGEREKRGRRKEGRGPARRSHLAPQGAGLPEASWLRRRAEMPQRRCRLPPPA